MSDPIKLDGSEVVRLIELCGEGGGDGAEELAKLEAWIGHPIPGESRELVARGVWLEHHDADHPYMTPEFFGELPDVGAFIDSFADGYQGRFNATCHFLGLYPIGQALQYGDFMFAMVVLEPHTGDQLGGMMYYDERECGTWGATASEFLHQSIHKFWEEMDGQADGLDEGEEPEYSTMYVRDCFVFDDYDPRDKPPDAVELPEAIEAAWEPHWRWRLENTSRWWLSGVLRGDFDVRVDQLPTAEAWEAEKAEVPRRYHQAMYWLLAHAVLDNREELAECVELAKQSESEGVRAVVSYLEDNPDLGDRWADARAAIFERVVRSRT